MMSDSVGDQHKQSAAAANPFEEEEVKEKKQHISEYTAQEIATLQSRLDKQLGPEYISSRPGAAGQKVHYLAAEKVINLANEIFGFNGWNSSVQNIQIDFVDEHPETKKITLGLSVIVRVTLKDGTYHEDVGYGHIENCKGKAAAFEKAKKEGTTDALKRALRTFGNVLGNCVYDKEYVSKVTKMKIGAGKWDEKNLHRHPDFAPKQQPALKQESVQQPQQSSKGPETSSGEKDSFIDIGEFDDAEFDDNDFDHPDAVVLPAEVPDIPIAQHANQQMQRNLATPSRPPAGPPGMQHPSNRPHQPNQSLQRMPVNGATNPRLEESSLNSHGQSSSPGLPSQHLQANAGAPPQSVGFFSARAAEHLDGDNITTAASNPNLRFNMHSESPSIRKTAGVDHSRSSKLLREGLQQEPLPPPQGMTHPRPDMARPTSFAPHSPMGRPQTNQYRPPTRRGPESNPSAPTGMTHGGLDRGFNSGARRPPLSDVSNVQYNQPHSVTAKTQDGADMKRQRVVGPDDHSAGNENRSAGGVG
jgi:DNA repair and recombination protein RAD52